MLHALKRLTLTLLSWGNIKYTTKISDNVRTKHALLMNVNHFLDLSSKNGCLIVTGLKDLSMQTLKKQEWTELSWQNKVDNAKFSVETRLEHGYAIECT